MHGRPIYQILISDLSISGMVFSVMKWLSIADLESVTMSAFSSNPVVEGDSTSARCSVDDGRPTVIKSAKWMNSTSDVDGILHATVSLLFSGILS